MGFWFEGYSFETIFVAIAVVLMLVFLNEASRKSKAFSILSFVVLPIIIMILILTGVTSSSSSKSWFGSLKTVSALIGVYGFMMIRYSKKIGKSKFSIYFPVAILGINIIEAIVRDIEVYIAYQTPAIDDSGLYLVGGNWNIINAVAGIFLLLSLTGWVGIKVANTRTKDMIWADQLWFWIMAYNFWNMAYCYNCISNRSMYAGLLLLLSAFIAEFCFKRGAWLQHRASTLAFFGMFSLALDYSNLPIFSIRPTGSVEARLAIAGLALASVGLVYFYALFRMLKNKINPFKSPVYSDLKAYKTNLRLNNLLDEECDQDAICD